MSKPYLRPGVFAGRYPQKLDAHEPPVSAWLRRRVAQLKDLVAHQDPLHPTYIVKHVNLKAAPLAALSEPALSQAIASLKEQLYRHGLNNNDIIIQAFAIIQEIAHRTLNKRYYDCQLFGGWVMMRGMAAEMATGEGKTLTSTLPVCTAALAGIPVHVITANDYLAHRDAELLRPLYKRLGLSVGIVVEGMSNELRQAQYACDIVHTTHKQVAFDYLRDRIIMADATQPLSLQAQMIATEQLGGRSFLLRGLCFAIVDEIDSVLIDEAATPLIISKTISTAEDDAAYVDGLYVAASLLDKRDFKIDFDQRHLFLTPEGKIRLADLSKSLPKIWQQKQHRETLITQALTAQHLLKRDQHYIIKDAKVQLIDQATGRAMPERAWEHGLQQMLEAKEGCLITPQREPLARISYQRFFKRYGHLAGTSGTIAEIAAELNAVYGLRVITISPHKPVQRKQLPERLYVNATSKWQALVERVKEIHALGRPILIGTVSIAESQAVSTLLTTAQLKHQVLNATQDEAEATIIAQAGQLGSITVATNMAGRGTDIMLGAGVSALGGLHVIATSRNDAQRIDRQLYGRCARQGDPGSTEAFLSLEDDRITQTCPPFLMHWLKSWGDPQQPLPPLLAKTLLTWQQKRTENKHYQMRQQLMAQDRQQAQLLAFSGRFE